MKLPSWSVYCDRTTPVNALRFDLGRVSVWFSYKIPVAFRTSKGLVVSTNCWGSLTGKHLNAIDGNKEGRLARKQFESELQLALKGEPCQAKCPVETP